MKRTAIAVAWIVGTTVPLLSAVVFVFGCCVLPFHASIHRALPFCHMALQVIGGEHARGTEEGQPLPAREKQEPVKRVAVELTRPAQFAALAAADRAEAHGEATAHRSFISLGALRCDQDVGLHLLTRTFLI